MSHPIHLLFTKILMPMSQLKILMAARLKFCYQQSAAMLMQVVLRKLFERLGATYIKLGEQALGSERAFIAVPKPTLYTDAVPLHFDCDVHSSC